MFSHLTALACLLVVSVAQTPATQCDRKADVVFLIDSSASVKATNYQTMLDFAVEVTRHFDVGSNGVQFGAIVYGNIAVSVFDLNTYKNRSILEVGIRSAPYLAELTFADKALKMARERSFTAAHGARPGVPKIAIVFTDGQSSNSTSTATQAALLKNLGVEIFTIGIGNTLRQSELVQMASAPEDVLSVQDFDALKSLEMDIVNRICQKSAASKTPGNIGSPTPSCEAKADVLFLLDSSGSVGSTNFKTMLEFVVNITRNFHLGPNAVQFAAITYSTDAKVVTDFNSSKTHAELEKALMGADYLSMKTSTNLALKMAREQLFTRSHGARPGVPQIAIVFTDGQSDTPTLTASEAKLLRDTGVKVFAIGIGSNVDQNELQIIASSPQNVFSVTNFDVLNSIERELANKTCQTVVSLTGTPKPTCEAEADILFILDSSGSVGRSNFDTMLQFVVNITRNFHLGQDAVQFAAITFASDSRFVTDFNTYTTHAELEKALMAAQYLSGTTNTDSALKMAREEAFTSFHGSRPGVPKIAIVFTDGQSDSSTLTASEAKLLQDTGVKVLSIGIGSSVDQTELQTIASSPQNVFSVTDFSVLESIEKELANKTCETVKEPPVNHAKCKTQADIMFVLDSTGSIASTDYTTMLDFVAKLTQNFKLGPDDVQFGALIFGQNAQMVFDLGTHTTHNDLEAAIVAAPYLAQNTHTDIALKMTREVAFTASHGARPGVPKIAIVLTDGKSENPTATTQEATLLKDSNVLVISIGVGSNVKVSELNAIASSPNDVYQVATFDVLDTIQNAVANKTCEIAVEQPKCKTQADIMFLLDSSGSVGSTDYTTMLDFVAKMTQNFQLGPNDVQFGTMIFGNHAQMVFDLGNHTNHNDLEAAVKASPYLSQATNTAEALKMARELAFTTAHGARAGVPKIAIVLTDGKSGSLSTTAQEATLLKDSGVLVISIGVGSSVNVPELNAIASSPDEVYQVATFDVLDSIQHAVANKTCEIAVEKPKCKTQADIMFLLDSSGSVGSTDYTTMLDFVAKMTQNFQLGPNDVQFGTMIFGNHAQMVFDLGNHTNHNDLEAAIKASPYLSQTTNTAEALKMARELAFTTAHGARAGVPKIAIVLTDGKSGSLSTTAQEATLLKDSGVLVVSIGVGSSVNVPELNSIASSPNEVYQVATFDVLDTIEHAVANKTCEIAVDTPKCKTEADIVFLLDSTGSISLSDYKTMLDFVAKLTQNFHLGPNDIQIGAMIFGDRAQMVFDLGTHTNHSGLEAAIKAAPYLNSNTHTDLALKLAREQAFTAHGARPGVPKIAIVLTDGQSQNPTATAQEATLLKDSNVLVISIGVGSNIRVSELNAIASSPNEVYQVATFDILDTIEHAVANKTCEIAVHKPKCNTEADIMFLVDSTESIDDSEYAVMLDFVANLTRNFQLGPRDVQFGAMVFGSHAQMVFDLGTHTDHKDLEAAIKASPYLAQTTHTDQALKLAREVAFTTAHGARSGVPKIAIVLTDGKSAKPTLTERQATALKDSGVLVIGIGVGTHIHADELNIIASSPNEVYQVATFDVLDTIEKAVANKTCEIAVPQPKCTTEADIMFLMESTGSISRSNYSAMLDFVAKFTRNFQLGPNDVQFGAMVFAQHPEIVFDLGTHDKHRYLEGAIRAAPYLGQGAHTNEAFQLARHEAFTAAHGARPGVPKIAIVLTDGKSAKPTATTKQATLLKNNKVQVISIGVGPHVNVQELNSMASSLDKVYQVASFDVLDTIAQALANQTCENDNEPPIQSDCDVEADVLFLLDASRSVGPDNFQTMLDFVVNVTRNFNMGPHDIQFGVITYGNTANFVFDLDTYQNHKELEKGLKAAHYMAQNTYTNVALKLAREEGFSTAHGARPGIPKIVIVCTDGLSSIPTFTASEAAQLKSNGTLLMSIGIGDQVQQSELETIASYPRDVFQVNSFDVLDTIERQVANQTCNLGTTGASAVV